MPDENNPLYGTPLWDKMTQAGAAASSAARRSRWMLSQFLHGEQGALLATAQLVDSVPWIDTKLYAATQVVDEARHVEVYNRYLHDKIEVLVSDQPAPEDAARHDPQGHAAGT